MSVIICHFHTNIIMYKFFQFMYVILKKDDKIGKQDRRTATCKDFLSFVAHINDLVHLYTLSLIYNFFSLLYVETRKKQELQ